MNAWWIIKRLSKAGHTLSNLLYNLVGLYGMLDSVWAGCTTRYWLVGLVGENQSSFDFKGAWPNVVQHFWQCVGMLYNIPSNISWKPGMIACSPCLKSRSFGNSCFMKVMNRCDGKYKWYWTVERFHWYIPVIQKVKSEECKDKNKQSKAWEVLLYNLKEVYSNVTLRWLKKVNKLYENLL